MATYEKEFLLKVLENLWKVRKFEQRAMEGGLKGEIRETSTSAWVRRAPLWAPIWRWNPRIISRPATAATATAS